MRHFGKAVKGWYVGPWNSGIPIAVGYANAGVNEVHFHAEMFEVYLVAQGWIAAGFAATRRLGRD